MTETKNRKSVSGDIEIWDYKASKPDTPYIHDYVRQLLTYAALYHRNNPEETLPSCFPALKGERGKGKGTRACFGSFFSFLIIREGEKILAR